MFSRHSPLEAVKKPWFQDKSKKARQVEALPTKWMAESRSPLKAREEITKWYMAQPDMPQNMLIFRSEKVVGKFTRHDRQ